MAFHSFMPRNEPCREKPIPNVLFATVLRVLISWWRRALTAFRWFRARARQSLRRLWSPGAEKTEASIPWHKNLYRTLGDRARQCGEPGERVPELILHDIAGNFEQLSRCWNKQPALLVTMSLSCGQSRRHARALRRLARRFERYINTVIIYTLEAHPIDASSPYANRIWITTKNEIAGIRCAQPQTLAERIELADQLRRRYRLSNSMLIDALDDRAWRTFGCAPNVAMLVQPDSRIAAKQGWFEPNEMSRAITALLRISAIRPDYQISGRE